MKRVKALQPKIEELIGEALELDRHVQDASYFTSLSATRRGADRWGGVQIQTVLEIRFSCFAQLFALHSCCDPGLELPPEVRQEVVAAVAEEGFVYVCAEELDCEYSGDNPHLKGETWWTRFFDYL